MWFDFEETVLVCDTVSLILQIEGLQYDEKKRKIASFFHRKSLYTHVSCVSILYEYFYRIVADTIPLLHMVFYRWCCLQCDMKYHICTTPTILLKQKGIEKKKYCIMLSMHEVCGQPAT